MEQDTLPQSDTAGSELTGQQDGQPLPSAADADDTKTTN
jgi:hypothetical protein